MYKLWSQQLKFGMVHFRARLTKCLISFKGYLKQTVNFCLELKLERFNGIFPLAATQSINPRFEEKLQMRLISMENTVTIPKERKLFTRFIVKVTLKAFKMINVKTICQETVAKNYTV